MKEDFDDVLHATNDIVRIERISHHIQRIREDQHAMRTAIEKMSEAGYHGDMRDLVWARFYEILAQVQAGQRSIPTEEELIAEMEALKG